MAGPRKHDSSRGDRRDVLYRLYFCSDKGMRDVPGRPKFRGRDPPDPRVEGEPWGVP